MAWCLYFYTFTTHCNSKDCTQHEGCQKYKAWSKTIQASKMCPWARLTLLQCSPHPSQVHATKYFVTVCSVVCVMMSSVRKKYLREKNKNKIQVIQPGCKSYSSYYGWENLPSVLQIGYTWVEELVHPNYDKNNFSLPSSRSCPAKIISVSFFRVQISLSLRFLPPKWRWMRFSLCCSQLWNMAFKTITSNKTFRNNNVVVTLHNQLTTLNNQSNRDTNSGKRSWCWML